MTEEVGQDIHQDVDHSKEEEVVKKAPSEFGDDVQDVQ